MACSMQIQRGEVWENSPHAVTSGRQRVDTQGVVLDHNNPCSLPLVPWSFIIVHCPPCVYQTSLKMIKSPRPFPPYLPIARNHKL